ncbi:Ger(x)C family spore germination protein [Clostridium culturomicium]|uniref:Ger(x)C family spore germination protein n=1 Tax=Clostridium culturomicium TaxID=1499683 RepID=UPI00058DCD84|nr:Ger(x)C family spore germination protein [Clostridium culturomicium]
MKNKVLNLILVLSLALLLTGCWDRIEIDRRAFVSTIGIDVGSDVDKKESLSEDVDINNYKDMNMVKITYGFPDLRHMDTQKGTTEGLSLTVDGYSPTDAYFKAASMSSRSLHFGHSKLLLLSNKVFDYPELEKEILDYIEREPNLNRSIIMAIVKGNTEDYIKVKPMMEDGIDSYITNLLGNSRITGTISPITLTKYIDMVKSKSISMLPVFDLKSEDEIELEGVAVIENNKIKAYLNNNEIENVQILRSDIGSSKKVVTSGGHPIDYYIETVDSNLDIKYIDNKLHLKYSIFTEGDLAGYYTDAKEIEAKDIKILEEELNTQMEKELLEVAYRTKNDLKLDVLEIEDKVKKYHYKLWESIKDNWSEEFQKAEISIVVKNQIRTVGIIN